MAWSNSAKAMGKRYENQAFQTIIKNTDLTTKMKNCQIVIEGFFSKKQRNSLRNQQTVFSKPQNSPGHKVEKSGKQIKRKKC